MNFKDQRSELAYDNRRLTKMPKPDEVGFTSKNGTSGSFGVLGDLNSYRLKVSETVTISYEISIWKFSVY